MNKKASKLPENYNVVIVNDFDYTQGGAGKIAIDTANLLVENFKNLNVYFFSAFHNENSTLNEKIIKIYTNQREALKDKNRFRGIINGIYNFKARREMKKLLKTLDNKNTVIHVHGWTKCLSNSIFDIAFKMNFKVVLTMHDYFIACPNGGYFNYNKNESCKLKPLSFNCIKCDCDSRNYAFKLYRIVRQFVQNKIVKLNDKISDVISISEFSEKILKETLNNNVNVHRIYNPVDLTDDLKKTDFFKNKYYLYVGRISLEKGTEIFCKNISELNLDGIVVGDGEQRKELENKYSNIKFVGWKNSSEVKKYMMNAKALIFPSLCYETMGLTVVEAMSFGIPVIVNSQCAASEFVIDGVNGFLYANENELKNKIVSVNKLKDNYKMYNFNKFKEEKYLNDIINVYGSMR